MKNAWQLLEEFTASSFRNPRKAAAMFAEDGAFEDSETYFAKSLCA